MSDDASVKGRPPTIDNAKAVTMDFDIIVDCLCSVYDGHFECQWSMFIMQSIRSIGY